MTRNILVSGAASGLGLEFLRRYASDPSNQVIGIDRHPLTDPILHEENIDWLQVDVTSAETLERLKSFLGDTPLDLIVHSAGIRGLVPEVEAQHPEDVAACETLEVMDVATMLRTFEINALGTFSLIRTLLPNLKRAAAPKVVIMSSRMGSVGHNTTAGSAYAYRASKAALNAIVKSFSVDVPEVAFVLCHPGRVETKLVKCKEEGAISRAESVTGLLPLIEKWDLACSGTFVDRFGDTIVW